MLPFYQLFENDETPCIPTRYFPEKEEEADMHHVKAHFSTRGGCCDEKEDKERRRCLLQL
jgi:hypothetical protein